MRVDSFAADELTSSGGTGLGIELHDPLNGVAQVTGEVGLPRWGRTAGATSIAA